MVVPGLALTARHVVEACLKRFGHWRELSPGQSDNQDVDFHLRAVQFHDADTGTMWTVRRIHTSAHTDVAFLQMASSWSPPPDPTATPSIRMNLLPPRVGSRVHAFGFAGGCLNVFERVEVGLDPRTTVGEVVAVHPHRRDRVLLPFPCFQTNARFDDNMSGGVVFDEYGHLCGLICASTPPSADDEDHASFVSLLWPALGTNITASRADVPDAVSYPAIDLIRAGLLEAHGQERFVLGNDGRPGFNIGGLDWNKPPTPP